MTTLGYARVQAALPQTELAVVAPHMLQLMLRNVATDGFTFVDPLDGRIHSKPGCILASPSYPQNPAPVDQDYVYHWTRDSAIAAIEIANNPVLLNPDGSSQELCDYVAFSKTCQDNAVAAQAFHRAAYRIDGTLRDWTDQKDGPALQNLAFIQAHPRLNMAAQAMAREIAQRNLDRIVADWEDNTGKFNPWEEVYGPSFFARSAQLRCLQEVQNTNALGLTLPANLAGAIAGLSSALNTHWDPGNGYYASVPNGQLGASSLLPNLDNYDPNSEVIMACIYGAVPCTDPKLLSTAAKLRAAFHAGGVCPYPINAADRGLGIGPLIGRYPSDRYDGDVQQDREHPTTGHPWALCTANFAELYYRLAGIFKDGGTVAYDGLTGSFYDQIGLDAATVNDEAQSGTVVQKLTDAGDRMLEALIYHSDHYELGEQFDATTGYVKSVANLTWSYAAYLSAVRVRP
jgi:glucoamylase